MIWSWEYTLEVLPKLLEVVHITLLATLTAFVVAMALGLVLALARMSHFKPLSYITYWFVEFVRTTPLLVQLFFIFYVLPTSFGITLSPFVAGVLGLGIHYSTYMSEVYRAGINSVDKGQWEAAIALNFSTRQKWQTVILPQAIRPVVPVMGNYLIVMFKETPVLSAITLVELLGRAQILGSQSFRYLEPFTLVGVFFLIISYSAALLVKKLELKLDLNQK